MMAHVACTIVALKNGLGASPGLALQTTALPADQISGTSAMAACMFLIVSLGLAKCLTVMFIQRILSKDLKKLSIACYVSLAVFLLWSMGSMAATGTECVAGAFVSEDMNSKCSRQVSFTMPGYWNPILRHTGPQVGYNRGFRRSDGTHIDCNSDHNHLALAPPILLEGTGGDGVCLQTWVSCSPKVLQESACIPKSSVSSLFPSRMPHTWVESLPPTMRSWRACPLSLLQNASSAGR